MKDTGKCLSDHKRLVLVWIISLFEAFADIGFHLWLIKDSLNLKLTTAVLTKIWKDTDITRATKLRFAFTLISPIATYASAT